MLHRGRPFFFALVTFLLGGSFVSLAQKQANVWYFGRNMGLDFNLNPPVLLLDGRIDYDDTPDNLEASSSIADEKGNLLFYTNGVKVWNRQHEVMPNGIELYGRNTTTQALIVPQPGSNTLFYIFTASPEGDDDYYPVEKRGFHYSIVDLSGDDGLGDVIAKNIKLVSSTTEKIAATKHVNGSDVWIVMHEWSSNIFRSYLVTVDGILPNVVLSQVGSTYSGGLRNENNWNAIGQMKISPNGEKLALVTYISKKLEVFNFDLSTGKLKLVGSISFNTEDEGRLYGLEFSPSSRYLYLTENTCHILQVDLNKPIQKENVTKVSDTPPCDEPSQLQLAPDGKIYVAQYGKFFIGAINKPNEAGALCEYEARAITIPEIPPLHSCNLGLPNFISSYFYNSELYPQMPYFQMPNIFTPNNDGYNDKFVPLMKYNVESYKLVLYNRWGDKIYQTTDLENGWDGWDCSSGMYYWQAFYTGIDGNNYSQKGVVHLLR